MDRLMASASSDAPMEAQTTSMAVMNNKARFFIFISKTNVEKRPPVHVCKLRLGQGHRTVATPT
jgi:hypothetical protein